MPTTSHRLIVIVSIIWVLGTDSMILLGALAYAAIHDIKLDPAYVTTIATLAGSVLGYIGGILSSAKTQDPQPEIINEKTIHTS